MRLLSIAVVYDTLCPYSRAFLTGTFWQSIKKLPADASDWQMVQGPGLWRAARTHNLMLEMLPYGNFRRGEDGSIQCQHGKSECELNHLHACLLTYLEGKSAVNSLVCTIYHNMKPMDRIMNLCVSKQTQDLITGCLASDAVVHDITGNITARTHSYVPWIQINGEYNEMARINFGEEVCKAAVALLEPGDDPHTELPEFCTTA